MFEGIDKLDRERTTAAFESLVGLVVTHFNDEEKLGLPAAHLVRSYRVAYAHERTPACTRAWYASTPLHACARVQKIHEDLKAVAVDTMGKLKSGAAKVDDGLVNYLKNWLKNHIKGSDMPAYGH